MLRATAISKVNFVLHKALCARTKIEVLNILCRHVALKQRSSLTSLPFRKIAARCSPHNRHKRPILSGCGGEMVEPRATRRPERKLRSGHKRYLPRVRSSFSTVRTLGLTGVGIRALSSAASSALAIRSSASMTGDKSASGFFFASSSAA